MTLRPAQDRSGPTDGILTAAEATDSPHAGGKAKALARAARAGLMVPPWFVVSAEAFRGSLTPAQRSALEVAADAASAGCILDGVTPSAEIRAAIERAVSALSPRQEPLAVRSSASDEDGAEHSFAGQLESYLHVAPAHVIERVVAVWRSAFSDRIMAYRREHGLPPAPRPPAVLIQRMIDPHAAGVAFSADPVSGRRGVTVVSAVYGVGSALVSGEADADTWLVDRAGTILERRIATKRTMHVTSSAAAGVDLPESGRVRDSADEGIQIVPVPAGRADLPSLTDDEIRAVANMACVAERHFERPQDIEWAAADRVYLLQSRPITSLRSIADPDARLAIWDNSNIVESYSGVTTPLTFSFVREIYQHVYQQFCRMMRVPSRRIDEHDETFRNMLGLVRGRLYYNLLNWYRVLALLPGYRVNRRFMEQMMGVKEPLPDAIAAEVAETAPRGRALDALYLVRTVAGLVANHLTLNRRVDAFTRRLDEALLPPAPALEERRPDELVAHYRALRGRLLLAWDAPLVNDFFAMIFYGLLRHLVTRWCGDAGGTLQNDLISGAGGIVSAEPALRMQRLARLAAAIPALPARMVSEPAAVIVPEMTGRLRDEYHAYLDTFGDRTVNELKLESATLHDDPLPLLRAVGALAQQMTAAGGPEEAAAGPSSGDRLRAEARERVAGALARHPIRRILFNWVLRHARRRVRDRENLRFERTRLFGRVRRIFLELGRRLHAIDAIDDPRDVMYLEVDEVLAFVEGRATCTDLRGLSALRRQEFRGYDALPAPDDRFETRGPVYQGHDFRQARPAAAEQGEARRGLGCCPGIVRGPVRIVTDPRTADLRQRAILVAEHTDPGWIMVFPSACGLLVERGSLLSHAAIVARELGIPAVVSIPGLTRWLKDGDWVELDGRAGTIRRLARPDTEAVQPTPAGPGSGQALPHAGVDICGESRA